MWISWYAYICNHVHARNRYPGSLFNAFSTSFNCIKTFFIQTQRLSFCTASLVDGDGINKLRAHDKVSTPLAKAASYSTAAAGRERQFRHWLFGTYSRRNITLVFPLLHRCRPERGLNIFYRNLQQ